MRDAGQRNAFTKEQVARHDVFGAGPFEQRAQAEAALEKLSEIGFGGKLMMK